jgi:NAD+ synthase (glutamine-hydrolysing)
MAYKYRPVRIACVSPLLSLGDVKKNAAVISELVGKHEDCNILVFPELCMTGYTCGDLFGNQEFIEQATQSLFQVLGANWPGRMVVVGCPIAVENALYNCAVVICGHEIVGIVPKSYLPNYSEFYEARWFQSGANAQTQWNIGSKENAVIINGNFIPFGTDLLFGSPEARVGVEICEDLWTPIPPSCHQALAGAHIILNLSASNELVGKADYRRNLVLNQSARCVAGYAYTSCGVNESSTDLVFGGHCMIAENGGMLAESERFNHKEATSIVADIDVERLLHDRRHMTDYQQCAAANRKMFRTTGHFFSKTSDKFFSKTSNENGIKRPNPALPFVPSEGPDRQKRCEEIFTIQSHALARRLQMLGNPHVTIGVSGGLDSTLALLVAVRAYNLLDLPLKQIHGFTMPGFGTTGRTKGNSLKLMETLGISSETIDIRQSALEAFKAMGHKPFGIDVSQMEFFDELEAAFADKGHKEDLTFENVQARLRTFFLMSRGFVIGTGDLSELALGWCTYNGDHMSMYNVNASIPKTLVRSLVDYVMYHKTGENEGLVETRTGGLFHVLEDILKTPVSPELLPGSQETEKLLGPYELYDFFLYHFVRNGYSAEKIVFLALKATGFGSTYGQEEIRYYLERFIKRFFTNQFKRSCVPDGPKVGSISLSPRGDWRMPSDAVYDGFMPDQGAQI